MNAKAPFAPGKKMSRREALKKEIRDLKRLIVNQDKLYQSFQDQEPDDESEMDELRKLGADQIMLKAKENMSIMKGRIYNCCGSINAQKKKVHSSTGKYDCKNQKLYTIIEKLKKDIHEKLKHIKKIQFENNILKITMDDLTTVVKDQKNKLTSSKLELKKRLKSLEAARENKEFLELQMAMLKANRITKGELIQSKVNFQDSLGLTSMKNHYKSKDLNIPLGVVKLKVKPGELEIHKADPEWLLHLIAKEKEEVFWLETNKNVESNAKKINYRDSSLSQLKRNMHETKMGNLMLKQKLNELKNKHNEEVRHSL